jgi:hypothetical protein
MHILSPVKWQGETFDSNSDSNWKVCEKTIKFLPKCHHYILCPTNHNIKFNQDNVTYIRYEYPKSVQLNRGMFDYRQITFDFRRIDVDYVFIHQPELTYNIHQWFHSNRYFDDVSFFGFYHWIDCNKSRGSLTGCPSFYMRQLESMHILDANFVHSQKSIEYLYSNFNGLDISSLVSKVGYMPLSSKIEVEPTPFELPDKKILVFNHRWNESSGIKKLIKFSEHLTDDYLIWVTDDNCDISNERFLVKHLPYSDYCYLLKNCHASLCFIDGYCTWNLSAQDSMLMGKPLLYYKHDTISKVVGDDYKGYFTDVEEFLALLDNLPNKLSETIHEHDFVFELQLKSIILDSWYDTKKPPKDAAAWINCIKSGITDKKSISKSVNEKVKLNGTAHFIRRHLLCNGIRDNVSSPYTQYFIEGDSRTKQRDLFSM